MKEPRRITPQPRRSRTNGAQHTSPGQARLAGAALGSKPKAAGAPSGREESFTPVVAGEMAALSGREGQTNE
jgi:hypothetical protein